jgi:hypothetical protein
MSSTDLADDDTRSGTRPHLVARGRVGPALAEAALEFQRGHPALPPLDVLDICLRGHAGRLADFGAHLVPGAPFAQLVCDAFGGRGTPWALVLSRFAERYHLLA